MDTTEYPAHKDEYFMRYALNEARRAAELGEVPIGCVIVDSGGKIIAHAHNLRETNQDPTAHAEILAIRRAASFTGSWRLSGTSLYVTIEPCPMCAGAIVLARIERLVFGAPDPKAGSVVSLTNIVQDARLNHWVDVKAGVLQNECSELMKTFFRGLR